jgi:hypothetical protein
MTTITDRVQTLVDRDATLFDRTVTLADGTTAVVSPGSLLPLNLHPDTVYYAMPGESIAAAKDSHILVRTTVAQRDANVRHTMKRSPRDTPFVLESAGRAIRNAMPGHDRVYGSMLRGERRGKKKWQDLIDDLNIVMSDQLVRGDTLRVLLEEPEVSEDGMSAMAPSFLMAIAT